MTDWVTRFAAISPEELDEVARSTRAEIDLRVSGEAPVGEVAEDFAEAWRRYVHIYFDGLRLQRMPTPEELAEFADVGRRRLHQSVELIDLQRAFRAGARILLDIALERVDERDAARVAWMTLRFEDVMATTAEKAYLDEQRALRSSDSDPGIQMLLRLINGEVDADDSLLRSGRIAGLDLTQPYLVIEFGQSRSATVAHLPDSGATERVAASLRALLPESIVVLPDGGPNVAVVPGQLSTSLKAIITGILSKPRTHVVVRAGVALARSGIDSFLPGLAEARRARLVGEVLRPSQALHSWEDIRRIDVFSDVAAINSLVQDTIGPLIEHDRRRGTQLLPTLAAFLDANSNRKLAASNLTIHINTLDYRLRQIQRVLDDEGLFTQPFTLHLAVRLYPLYELPALE
jgi:sugar diacid utilization regulator